MAEFAIPIILLAAGSSSRMRGGDKLLEQIDGVPLLRLQAEKACAATTGPVLITLPPTPHPRYDLLSDLAVQTIPVPNADAGMSASLRAGIAALPKDNDAAMIFLADLPDVTAEDLRTVAASVNFSSDNQVWRGATQTGAPGHPIVFRADLFDAIAKLTGDTGGRDVVALAKGHVVLVPLEGDRARCDLDTPEAWAAWRAKRNQTA